MKLAHVEGAACDVTASVVTALSVCLSCVRWIGGPSPVPDGIRVVPLDKPSPLQVLHAALQACDVSGVLLASNGLTHLEPRVVLALLSLVPEFDPPAAVAPLGPNGPDERLGFFSRALLPRVEVALEANHRSLGRFLGASDALLVPSEKLAALGWTT